MKTASSVFASILLVAMSTGSYAAGEKTFSGECNILQKWNEHSLQIERKPFSFTIHPTKPINGGTISFGGIFTGFHASVTVKNGGGFGEGVSLGFSWEQLGGDFNKPGSTGSTINTVDVPPGKRFESSLKLTKALKVDAELYSVRLGCTGNFEQ